jgi:asparagine synthase (glutamine-hydrolysing)
LAPGHFLWWRNGQTAIRKYWDLSYATAEGAGDAVSTGALLQDAVSRHLVSDVPLGVFLSGGLDSGAIVALATRALTAEHAAHGAEAPGRRLTTLTVTFDEPEFSEAVAARAVADRFGTDHHEVRVTRSDFVAELPKILAAMDQPTNDGVNTYFVSKAARQLGLTVVLSGLGGDELFWGYRHYRWLGASARWLAACPDTARHAISQWASLWGRMRGQEKWLRMTFLGHDVTSRGLYLMMRGFFPPQHIMRLLGVAQRNIDDAIERHFDTLPQAVNGDTVNGFNYIELKRYLHDQLLRDTDVFSMAHSIEARVPFLDDVVVDHVTRIPPELKIGHGVNKPVLVDAADDALLRQAGGAAKRGFSLPMDKWMKASAGDLEDLALSSHVLDPPTVRALWSQFRAGRLHWSRAWALSVLGSTLAEPLYSASHAAPFAP